MSGFNWDGFDPETVEDSMSPIPQGKYLAMIIDAENTVSQKTGAEYSKLTLQLQGGDYDGRKIFHNLSLTSENDIARNIAAQNLAQICKATGKIGRDRPRDISDLRDLVLIVNIGIQKNDSRYNEVKGYEPRPIGNASLPKREERQVTRQQQHIDDDTPFKGESVVTKGELDSNDTPPWKRKTV